MRNAKEEFSQHLEHRLEAVTIENRHAFEVIDTYDGSETFFHFIDPPYVNSDCGHYEGVFGVDDLARLLELIVKLKGKVMLTCYYRYICADFFAYASFCI